jgi:hypothetical protein
MGRLPPDDEPDCAELRRMASNWDLMRLIRLATVPAPEHIHRFRAIRAFHFQAAVRNASHASDGKTPEQA